MNLMHYIIFYYCRSTKAIADIDEGRETTRGESLSVEIHNKEVKHMTWIHKFTSISDRITFHISHFTRPCRGLVICRKLLQDLQLVHPRLLLCSKSRG